jgi:hypothetical protein
MPALNLPSRQPFASAYNSSLFKCARRGTRVSVSSYVIGTSFVQRTFWITTMAFLNYTMKQYYL